MKTKNMVNTKTYIIINEILWETVLPNYQNLTSQITDLTVNFINDNDTLDFTKNKQLIFNLCLSNDDEVHSLNKEFRGLDKPTNVLSFANIDSDDFEELISIHNEIEMGDIIISLQTLQKEANEKNISLHNHFCHLLIHGILHLLGYDHIEDHDAEIMEGYEIQILEKLNIANPYQE